MKIALDLRFWRSGTGGLGRYSRNLLQELLLIDRKNQYTAIITPEDEPEFDQRLLNLTKLAVPIERFLLSGQLKLSKILTQGTSTSSILPTTIIRFCTASYFDRIKSAIGSNLAQRCLNV